MPRFNMPFELGLFLGALKLGTTKQRQKDCLILDREKYRYQRFISDIAGQDIESHSGDYSIAVKRVRNWLNSITPASILIPGGIRMAERYQAFRTELPQLCTQLHLAPNELTFADVVYLVSGWQQENPWY